MAKLAFYPKTMFQYASSWPPCEYCFTFVSKSIALDFVKSCGFNDICVGKLFSDKYNLILELSKVSLRDRFSHC